MAELPTPVTDANGRLRVVIESLAPSVDGGQSPSKRIEGELVRVEAEMIAHMNDR